MRKRIFGCALFLVCISLLLSACAYKGTSNTVPSATPTEGGDNALPDAYAEIISNIIHAYPWNDGETDTVPENPELSYLYRYNSALSEVGFAWVDLDNNGQPELIIADVDDSFIYDLYTISDGEAVHLFDSGERYCYFLYENGYIENQWSGSAATSGHDFYKISDGKLEFAERIVFDAHHALDAGLIDELSQANDDKCFFTSETDQSGDYQSVTAEEARKAIETYQGTGKPFPVEYTLLSEYKK